MALVSWPSYSTCSNTQWSNTRHTAPRWHWSASRHTASAATHSDLIHIIQYCEVHKPRSLDTFCQKSCQIFCNIVQWRVQGVEESFMMILVKWGARFVFSALTLLAGHQEKLSNEVLAWLSVWREMQTICIWSGWCRCHPIISCFFKIQINLTFLVPAYPGCPANINNNNNTRLTVLFLGLPRWASTRKIKPIWICWSKRQWVALASAVSYANLHLTRQITMPAPHHSGCPGKEAVKWVSAEMEGERILKIGQHLVKLWATVWVAWRFCATLYIHHIANQINSYWTIYHSPSNLLKDPSLIQPQQARTD